MRYLMIPFALALGFLSPTAQASEDVPVAHARTQLSDAECYEIAGMYAEMQRKYQVGQRNYMQGGPCSDYVAVIGFQEQHQAHGGTTLQLIRDLTIECSMDTIRRVFRDHGVLQLRPLNGRNALLGCGNGPIEIKYKPADPELLKAPVSDADISSGKFGNLAPVHFCDHRHEGYDTINPALTMNPTVVAALGFDNLGLLPTTYYKVTYEGIDPVGTETYMAAFKHHFAKAQVCEIRRDSSDIRINLEQVYPSVEALLQDCMETQSQAQ